MNILKDIINAARPVSLCPHKCFCAFCLIVLNTHAALASPADYVKNDNIANCANCTTDSILNPNILISPNSLIPNPLNSTYTTTLLPNNSSLTIIDSSFLNPNSTIVNSLKSSVLNDVNSSQSTAINDDYDGVFDGDWGETHSIKLASELNNRSLIVPDLLPGPCSNLDGRIVAADILGIWLVAFISAFLPYFPFVKQNQRMISLINCLGAGILLGTCFFHYMPEVREEFERTAGYDPHALHFELYTICGFLLILLTEQFITTYVSPFFTEDGFPTHCHSHNEPGELGNGHGHESGNGHGHGHSHAPAEHGPEQAGLLVHASPSRSETSSGTTVPVANGCLPETVLEEEIDDHCHEDVQSHSALRSIAFVVSLAVHSVVEGAALTLQAKDWGTNSTLLISIGIHKVAIGLTMGFTLKSSKLTRRDAQIALFTWTVFSPLGGLIAYLGCQSELFNSSSIPPLNAIGLGTFLYVLFFEIAPHEFLGTSEKPNKFFKSLVLVAGVGFTFWLNKQFAHSHEDSVGHEGHDHGAHKAHDHDDHAGHSH